MAQASKIPAKRAAAKKSAKQFITQKETALLLNSTVIDDYPDWRDRLSHGPLTLGMIAALPPEEQHFAETVLLQLVTQSSKEWKLQALGAVYDLGPERDNWGHCTLCNTPNRYIFYIVNQRNGNRMNVGSDCMKKFDIDISVGGRSLPQLIREASRLRRVAELEQTIPGVQRHVYSWNGDVERFPLLIPNRFERPFRDAGSQALELYNEYVDPDKVDSEAQSTRDAEIINTLKELLQLRVRMLAEMETFVRENLGKPYSVSRKIVRWLEQRSDSTALNWLREDGEVLPRTIHRIAEPEFMNSLSAKLDALLRKSGWKLAGIDSARSSYIVVPLKGPDIRLLIRHNDLLLKCGMGLFGEQPEFSYEHGVDLGKVADRVARDKALGELGLKLHPLGLVSISANDIINDVDDLEAYFDEWLLHEKRSGKYIVVDKLDRLADEFKWLAFGVGTQTPRHLADAVAGPSVQRLTLRELSENYKARLRERISMRRR